MEKKIIDRIIASDSAPASHDLWIDTSNGECKLKVNINGNNTGWKTVGGSGSGSGGSENVTMMQSFVKIFFDPNVVNFPISPVKIIAPYYSPSYTITADSSIPLNFVNKQATKYNVLDESCVVYDIEDIPDNFFELYNGCAFLYDLDELNELPNDNSYTPLGSLYVSKAYGDNYIRIEKGSTAYCRYGTGIVLIDGKYYIHFPLYT